MNSTELQLYKVNVQKSIAFLYTSNEWSEDEFKKTISFIIVYKRIKYLGRDTRKM